MVRNSKVTVVVFILFVFAGKSLLAQEAKAQPSTGTYRLDYVFSELQDNKRINARSYTVLVRAMQKGVIKSGSRIPVAIGEVHGASEQIRQEIQYLDVGMNIDCRVGQELDSAIELMTSADSSSVVQESQPQNHTSDPVIRQLKYDFDNIIPLGKQALLGSVDEVEGTRRLQIEVTATKVR